MKIITVVKGEPLGLTFQDKLSNLKRLGAKDNTGNIFVDDMICLEDQGIWAKVTFIEDMETYRKLRPYGGPRKIWMTLENAKDYIHIDIKPEKVEEVHSMKNILDPKDLSDPKVEELRQELLSSIENEALLRNLLHDMLEQVSEIKDNLTKALAAKK